MKSKILDKASQLFFSILLISGSYFVYAKFTGQFEKHKSWVNAVDINKANLIASASENEILLWKGRKCIGKLIGHSESILSVAFTNAGQYIATGSLDNSVKIWSVSTQKIIKTFNKHHRGIKKLAFSKSDQYLITAGYDNELIIWDWKNNRIIKKFKITDTHFSISKSDILAFVDGSNCVTYFDLKTLKLKTTSSPICGLPEFDRNHEKIAIINSFVTVLDNNSGKVLSTVDIFKNQYDRILSSYNFTPDGQYFVVGFLMGDVEIWNLQTGQLHKTLIGNQKNSTDQFVFNSKNQLITGSTDQSVKVWNWENGDLLMSLGDGSFEEKLVAWFAISLLLTLMTAFSALLINSENKFPSLILLIILSIWTFGFGIAMYFIRSKVSKFATAMAWISTVISVLFILTFYFSWLAIFSIPVSLLFCYIKIISGKGKVSITFPLIINLIFCVGIVALITKQCWN